MSHSVQFQEEIHLSFSFGWVSRFAGQVDIARKQVVRGKACAVKTPDDCVCSYARTTGCEQFRRTNPSAHTCDWQGCVGCYSCLRQWTRSRPSQSQRLQRQMLNVLVQPKLTLFDGRQKITICKNVWIETNFSKWYITALALTTTTTAPALYSPLYTHSKIRCFAICFHFNNTKFHFGRHLFSFVLCHFIQIKFGVIIFEWKCPSDWATKAKKFYSIYIY